jgi:hypothetical protein
MRINPCGISIPCFGSKDQTASASHNKLDETDSTLIEAENHACRPFKRTRDRSAQAAASELSGPEIASNWLCRSTPYERYKKYIQQTGGQQPPGAVRRAEESRFVLLNQNQPSK